jgi:hypothetical protein
MLYLVETASGAGGRVVAGERDPLARFDRSSSFALVDRMTPPGCALDFAVARAIARASMMRTVPATDEGSARAQSDAVARLVTPCAGPDSAGRALFQSIPERSVVDPLSAAYDEGAGAFFDWLDVRFGVEPGALLKGLWALAATRTPPGADRWAGAPTDFDVLRVSLKDALGRGSNLDDVLVQFAVARVSMFPSPRPAWDIPWPDRARRLAAPKPVAPTGASYVRIDCAGAPPGAKLRLEAEWEDYARMRWVALKLDPQDGVMAQVPIRTFDPATHASMTLDGIDGVSRVIVVGANVGSTDHPFDPDQGEWEPHGWLLTVAAE